MVASHAFVCVEAICIASREVRFSYVRQAVFPLVRGLRQLYPCAGDERGRFERHRTGSYPCSRERPRRVAASSARNEIGRARAATNG